MRTLLQLFELQHLTKGLTADVVHDVVHVPTTLVAGDPVHVVYFRQILKVIYKIKHILNLKYFKNSLYNKFDLAMSM